MTEKMECFWKVRGSEELLSREIRRLSSGDRKDCAPLARQYPTLLPYNLQCPASLQQRDLQHTLKSHAPLWASIHSALTPVCLPACPRAERTRPDEGEASTLCSLLQMKEHTLTRWIFSVWRRRWRNSLHTSGHSNADCSNRSYALCINIDQELPCSELKKEVIYAHIPLNTIIY